MDFGLRLWYREILLTNFLMNNDFRKRASFYLSFKWNWTFAFYTLQNSDIKIISVSLHCFARNFYFGEFVNLAEREVWVTYEREKLYLPNLYCIVWWHSNCTTISNADSKNSVFEKQLTQFLVFRFAIITAFSPYLLPVFCLCLNSLLNVQSIKRHSVCFQCVWLIEF